MDEEKLMMFLKKYLRVEINHGFGDVIEVSLYLKDEEISSDFINIYYAKEYHSHDEEG